MLKPKVEHGKQKQTNNPPTTPPPPQKNKNKLQLHNRQVTEMLTGCLILA